MYDLKWLLNFFGISSGMIPNEIDDLIKFDIGDDHFYAEKKHEEDQVTLSCIMTSTNGRSKRVKCTIINDELMSIKVTLNGYDGIDTVEIIVDKNPENQLTTIKVSDEPHQLSREIKYTKKPDKYPEIEISEQVGRKKTKVRIKNTEYQYCRLIGEINGTQYRHQKIETEERIENNCNDLLNHPTTKLTIDYIEQLIEEQLPGLYDELQQGSVLSIINKKCSKTTQAYKMYNLCHLAGFKLPMKTEINWYDENSKVALYNTLHSDCETIDYKLLECELKELLRQSGLIDIKSCTVKMVSQDDKSITIIITTDDQIANEITIIYTRNDETPTITVKYSETYQYTPWDKREFISHEYMFDIFKVTGHGEIKLVPRQHMASSNFNNERQFIKEVFNLGGSILITRANITHESSDQNHGVYTRTVQITPANRNIEDISPLKREMVLWYQILSLDTLNEYCVTTSSFIANDIKKLFPDACITVEGYIGGQIVSHHVSPKNEIPTKKNLYKDFYGQLPSSIHDEEKVVKALNDLLISTGIFSGTEGIRYKVTKDGNSSYSIKILEGEIPNIATMSDISFYTSDNNEKRVMFCVRVDHAIKVEEYRIVVKNGNIRFEPVASMTYYHSYDGYIRQEYAPGNICISLARNDMLITIKICCDHLNGTLLNSKNIMAPTITNMLHEYLLSNYPRLEQLYDNPESVDKEIREKLEPLLPDGLSEKDLRITFECIVMQWGEAPCYSQIYPPKKGGGKHRALLPGAK